MKALTGKQIAFAHYVVDGLTATEAYRRAYSTNGKETVRHVKAHEVRHHPAVAALINELQAELRATKRIERDEKRRVLSQLIRDRDADPRVRLEAIKIDNLMCGDNQPQQVEVFGLSALLATVRKKSH